MFFFMYFIHNFMQNHTLCLCSLVTVFCITLYKFIFDEYSNYLYFSTDLHGNKAVSKIDLVGLLSIIS